MEENRGKDMKKTTKRIFFLITLAASFSVEAGVNICHKNGCQMMSSYQPSQVMEALSGMFPSDARQIVFCEADPNTKVCRGQPLSFLGRSNLMHTTFQIPFARIEQKKKDNLAVQLVLDYQLKVNQFYPECTPSPSALSLGLSWGGDIRMVSPKFECRIMELGNTYVTLDFQVDYLDLERNRLGAYYKAVVEGDILAGGSGYVVMQPSTKRAPEIKRLQPTDLGVAPEQYTSEVLYQSQDNDKSIVDWDLEDWKKAWNSFTDKFWKVLYLEPLDD